MVASSSSSVSMAVMVDCAGMTTSTYVLGARFENDVPVALHANHGDPVRVRFLQPFVKRTQPELAVIGDFSLSVVMVKEKSHARAFAGFGIPHHRQITIRVAKRQNRPPTDVQSDVLRLRLAIVEAIEFGKLHHPNLVLAHFKP